MKLHVTPSRAGRGTPRAVPLRQASATSRLKYRNKPTFVDGRRFASKAEARRYQELLLLERGKEINKLRLQPRYQLDIDGIHITEYRADFVYWDIRKGKEVVEDVKGVLTVDCQIKLRLMLALHKIDVKLVAA